MGWFPRKTGAPQEPRPGETLLVVNVEPLDFLVTLRVPTPDLFSHMFVWDWPGRQHAWGEGPYVITDTDVIRP